MYTKQDRRMQLFAHMILILITIIAILPFVLLVMVSLTDNDTAIAEGYRFWPGKFSLDAYGYIIDEWSTIGRAYGVTIFVTIIGTAGSLIVSSMFAYALSHKDLPGRKLLTFLVVFTMLFNGGIVSSYFIYTNVFNIKNTIFALLIPNLFMSAFNLILLRNYFETNIPSALLEAANIDGAGEWILFIKIVIPLSLPILATVGLITAIGYWNDWTNGLYFLNDRDGSHLYSIQNVLNRINENINFLANNSSQLGMRTDASQLPTTTMRMAIAVVGILPIMVFYPFFQKYFVKGITIGSVKE